MVALVKDKMARQSGQKTKNRCNDQTISPAVQADYAEILLNHSTVCSSVTWELYDFYYCVCIIVYALLCNAYTMHYTLCTWPLYAHGQWPCA